MKIHRLSFAIVTLVACIAVSAAPSKSLAQSTVSTSIGSAMADPSRPADERAQDVHRKPAQVLRFAGIRPGDKVVDLMPGSGYYTRMLSKLVGPNGKVYALQPTEMDKAAPKGLASLRSFAGTPAYPNVIVLVQPIASIHLPEPVDLFWTSQNYHDLHDPFMGTPDMAKFDRSVLDALKPSGKFVILDHAAAAGSGFTRTDDFHRVDPAAVKAEVIAAGFEYVGESDALSNPADDHSRAIFDPSIKDRTDKFIYKFRKPMN